MFGKLELYFANYENFLIVGDFNLDEKNPNLTDFINSFSLENVIKERTCFKSDSPTCIDLIQVIQASSQILRQLKLDYPIFML